MDVLLVVDMQTALLEGPPKHDLDGVIDRINRLAAKVRSQAGKIIFVQHVDDGGNVGPLPPACQLLPDLEREPSDIVVHKHLNDAFAGSNLKARLDDIAPDRLLIAAGPPISALIRPCDRRCRMATTSSWSPTLTR
jgi:nicotinamidase-related amidase